MIYIQVIATVPKSYIRMLINLNQWLLNACNGEAKSIRKQSLMKENNENMNFFEYYGLQISNIVQFRAIKSIKSE